MKKYVISDKSSIGGSNQSRRCCEVALHYARTWLMVDVVTAIPFEYVPGYAWVQ